MATKKKATAATTKTPNAWKPKNPVLILRFCGPDGESYNGFRWPLKVGAVVEAPDWDPEPGPSGCGRGLHGWLWGEGNLGFRREGTDLDDPKNQWIVCEADATEVTQLSGKVKARRVVIRFVGKREEAACFVVAHGGAGKRVHYGTATAGYSGTATAGDSGTATAGYRGTATAGYSGTATAGYSGTATAGDSGTATAGDSGTATAGDYGTATAGDRGTATAGDRGTVVILWYDPKAARYRTRSADIGEDGYLPGVPYCCNDSGKVVIDERATAAIVAGLMALGAKP